ncbi:MAG: tartrate-resistant acid phosphatase type 5 [Patiriisocius sp.]|jgi:tartrate-resistant acid phosphatase type 5
MILLLRRSVNLILALTVIALLPTVFFAYTLLKPVAPQTVELDFPDATTLSFFALGDQGVGNLRQWQVADAMERQAGLDSVQGVLLLGDNFYRYGVSTVTDWQWRYKFEHVYTGSLSAIAFFATLGNHDYYGNELAQISYDAKNLGSGRWQMPARDYVRHFGQQLGREGEQALVRIVFVDTGLWLRSPIDATTVLDQLLATANAAQWTVVVTHTPLISGNTLDTQPIAHELWQPVLESHGVDLLLSGHDHNMQYLQRDGWPAQAIIGVGGKSGQTLDSDEVPGLEFYASETGFGRMVVTAEELVLQYYNSEEALLFESRLLAD